jgi:hypothetical protein
LYNLFVNPYLAVNKYKLYYPTWCHSRMSAVNRTLPRKLALSISVYPVDVRFNSALYPLPISITSCSLLLIFHSSCFISGVNTVLCPNKLSAANHCLYSAAEFITFGNGFAISRYKNLALHFHAFVHCINVNIKWCSNLANLLLAQDVKREFVPSHRGCLPRQ